MDIGVAIGSAMGYEKNQTGWGDLSTDDRAAIVSAITRVFAPLIDVAEEIYGMKSVFLTDGCRTEQYRLPETIRNRLWEAVH